MAVISLKRLKEIKENSKDKYVEILGIDFKLITDGFEIEKRKSRLDFKRHFKGFKTKEVAYKKLSKETQEYYTSTLNTTIDPQTVFRLSVEDMETTEEKNRFHTIKNLAESLCSLDLDFKFFDEEDIEQNNPLVMKDLIKELWEINPDDMIEMAMFLFKATAGSLHIIWDIKLAIDAVLANKSLEEFKNANMFAYQLNTLVREEDKEKFFLSLAEYWSREETIRDAKKG